MSTVWKFLSCNLKLHTHHEHEELKLMGMNKKDLARERERKRVRKQNSRWQRIGEWTEKGRDRGEGSSQAHGEVDMGDPTTLQPGENVNADSCSCLFDTRNSWKNHAR